MSRSNKKTGFGAGATLRAGGTGLIAAIVFALVLCVSTANALRARSPALAIKWAPADSASAASLAAAVLGSDASPELRSSARAAAVAALRRDPTTVAALRGLGLAADAEGDQAEAARLFTAAERLSRRDQATEAWLIRHYSSRGDTARTIHHFDTALRASYARWDTLLALLVQFSADPRALPPLERLLATRPVWGSEFATRLAARGQPLTHVVRLTRGMFDISNPAHAQVVGRLLGRLVEAGQIDLAWNVYLQHRPDGRGRGAVSNGGFEAADGLAPFDWALVDDMDLGAVRETRAGSGNVLRLLANSGRGGDVARQLVRLPPRSYLIQLEMADIPADAANRPRVSVRCAGTGGRTLLDVRPASGGEAMRRVAARFTVPAGCRWQWLSIRAEDQGSSSVTGPTVDNIVIAAVS